ncbi:unnamed protein product [Arctia plantaginis]|uniref:Queuosine 5'-phosphate N-glycosylase/hydrolase n=1 Tax=Arctia plantaginis TaxID=874455 RepID=A0A8S1A6H1_ARCPL|nr:unnamed protein product [Arctia plantaginis]
MAPEVLLPAQSGEFIAKNAKYVKIHETGLDKLSDEMVLSIKNKLEVPDTGVSIMQVLKDHKRAADWVFVADALNFCFWSYTNAQKWTVDGQTGYYALEAALARAMKEGIDITNPGYYSKITKEQLQSILRGDNEVQIPLFEERFSVLHEVGAVLLTKYNGTFVNCLKEANKSAVKLLDIIVNDFPCFRDVATYKGQKVALYKRAQILVADLWNLFGGTCLGEFTDIDKITMFADYRIPQVLAYFGVLTYSDELMDKLKNDVLLPSGSEEEVEIRGCSIHAIELLKKRIEGKIQGQNVEVPNSSLIDYYLWCYRRKYADEMESIPFHKTLDRDPSDEKSEKGSRLSRRGGGRLPSDRDPSDEKSEKGSRLSRRGGGRLPSDRDPSDEKSEKGSRLSRRGGGRLPSDRDPSDEKSEKGSRLSRRGGGRLPSDRDPSDEKSEKGSRLSRRGGGRLPSDRDPSDEKSEKGSRLSRRGGGRLPSDRDPSDEKSEKGSRISRRGGGRLPSDRDPSDEKSEKGSRISRRGGGRLPSDRDPSDEKSEKGSRISRRGGGRLPSDRDPSDEKSEKGSRISQRGGGRLPSDRDPSAR